MRNYSIVVCGGLRVGLDGADLLKLDFLRATELVTTGRKVGVEGSALAWAKASGLKIRRFPDNWDKNEKMARAADAVVIFDGGAETRAMHRVASEAGVPIYDFRTT